MRVLLDCRMVTWSGVGRYSRGLAAALARREDVELLCVAPKDESHLLPPGVAHESAERSPLSLAGMRELAGIVTRVHPNLTHCLHFPTPLPAAHPLVVTLHDVTPLTIEGVMPSALRRAAYRWFNARAVRLADVIVTPSAFTATEVVRLFPLARGKTHVTLEGADDFAEGALEPLSPGLDSLVSAPYILSMGSTRTHKDLPTLIRAFSAIASSRPGLTLLLVGPEDAHFLAATGLAPELAERVRFTGPVTDGQLRTLYSRAAVFAFPSRHEGFGLPPLEAMALGAPVACSDAASLPEVVGDAAELFGAGDSGALAGAISRILDDDALRARLVSAGRERAALLTWDAAAESTIGAYRAALTG